MVLYAVIINQSSATSIETAFRGRDYSTTGSALRMLGERLHII